MRRYKLLIGLVAITTITITTGLIAEIMFHVVLMILKLKGTALQSNLNSKIG